MTTHFARPTSGIERTDPASAGRLLLWTGAAAGPAFIAAIVVQMLTRQGFDLGRQPLSLLSLGSLGWIQVTNFIVTGGMAVIGAIGMARALSSGRGSTWVPRLTGAYGAGLILAGVFPADPANGFPAGAPEGAPTHITWHNNLHGVGAGLAFTALVVAGVIFARRMAAAGNQLMTAYSAVTGAAVVITMAAPVAAFSIRLFVSSVLTWAWLTVTCAYLSHELGA
jgi:Protein of unknown function (DUF998)